jgi:hypothetical protein
MKKAVFVVSRADVFSMDAPHAGIVRRRDSLFARGRRQIESLRPPKASERFGRHLGQSQPLAVQVIGQRV